jgi:hypothetical protein
MVRGSGECSMAPELRSAHAPGLPGSLLSDEAVLDHQLVIRIGVLPEQVSELAVE